MSPMSTLHFNSQILNSEPWVYIDPLGLFSVKLMSGPCGPVPVQANEHTIPLTALHAHGRLRKPAYYVKLEN